jgi:hypothetical protein
MSEFISPPLFAASLFVALLIALEIGRRWGLRRAEAGAEPSRAGLGTVEGAVFALFGLLLAFTFHGAASRFDVRRALIVEEANAIGTAYLRLDMLPAAAQPALRQLFRTYVDSRLEIYRRLPDLEAAMAELARSKDLQSEIWRNAIAALRSEGSHPGGPAVVLPALNQMIDVTTKRTMAARTHPPWIVYILLFGLGVACALLAGHGMAGARRRSWMHIAGFTVIVVVTIYVTLDLEYPRMGLFRVDAFDQVLVEVRQSMK